LLIFAHEKLYFKSEIFGVLKLLLQQQKTVAAAAIMKKKVCECQLGSAKVLKQKPKKVLIRSHV
jgi:hypothetical protein